MWAACAVETTRVRSTTLRAGVRPERPMTRVAATEGRRLEIVSQAFELLERRPTFVADPDAFGARRERRHVSVAEGPLLPARESGAALAGERLEDRVDDFPVRVGRMAVSRPREGEPEVTLDLDLAHRRELTRRDRDGGGSRSPQAHCVFKARRNARLACAPSPISSHASTSSKPVQSLTR